MSEEEARLIERYEEKIQDEKYTIYCLEQRIAELENINDKLSNALNSAEQRTDKVIKYIKDNNSEKANGADYFIISDYFENLLSILEDKEL